MEQALWKLFARRLANRPDEAWIQTFTQGGITMLLFRRDNLRLNAADRASKFDAFFRPISPLTGK